jgi:DNA-binding HxlR family transcriptional regulator
MEPDPGVVSDSGVVSVDAIAGTLAAVRQPADAVCDRWTLEIVLQLLPGARRYSDILRLSGIASRLVASRLAALQALGIVDRRPYSDGPLRFEYFLTRMGLELRAVLGQMIRWEQSWSVRAAPADSTVEIQERLLGKCDATSDCAFCFEPVTARTVTLKIEPALLRKPPQKQKARRRTSAPSASATQPGNLLPESLSIFGDKWGIEILICAFFGIRRFIDFRSATGISANILSDRLARLTTAGILSEARPNSDAHGYWLTEKGLDLYSITVAVQTWADHWLPDRIRSPVRLIHRPCGREIVLRSSVPVQ